jgi:hypothetical protein
MSFVVLLCNILNLEQEAKFIKLKILKRELNFDKLISVYNIDNVLYKYMCASEI